MAKINMEITLHSPEEKSRKNLVGELQENQISYIDGGFLVSIKWQDEAIILTKSNNNYKIAIRLEKNNSAGTYEDLKSKMCLKMKVDSEDFAISNNCVKMSYVIEDLNKISYSIKYEVQE